MSNNCVDIIRPFAAEINGSHNLQVVGGVGAFVLGTSGVEIFADERIIAASGDTDFSQIGQYRPDGNLRDFDVLVMSTDPGQIQQVEGMAQDTIGNALELSVFGLHTQQQLEQMKQFAESAQMRGDAAIGRAEAAERRAAAMEKVATALHDDILAAFGGFSKARSSLVE